MAIVPEFEKYSRHFLIQDFDTAEQEKLRDGRVLVIGAGGLGSPVLMYLSGAGVGHIGIVENDSIALSNMHRQILYSTNDIGKKKAHKARERMKSLNSDCDIEVYEDRWTEKNAYKLSEDIDVLVDCTDNHASRYLTDEVSRSENIPFVYGAIHDLEGQVAVFNFRNSKGYSDIFPVNNEAEHKPAGVIGPLAGMVGSLQAAEVIKIITGIGEVMCNKILFISIKHNRYQLMNL